ncbi:MFS transporter [Halobaculum gomorrense]|uniref:MFS transporter n=1 Tax=Halobaculum gomorrense TaxID=43928 RepID=UPI00093390B9|nr:MFS transporter [Halobaculum gomorrense]
MSAVSASQYLNHAYLVLFPPILAVLSGEFEVGLAALGVALGVQGATNTAFQLPFGRLADRYDRTLAFGLSSVVRAVGVLAAAAAPTYEWLLVAQAVIGIGVAGHHPAHYPLISDSTPDDLMGRAYSLYGFGGRSASRRRRCSSRASSPRATPGASASASSAPAASSPPRTSRGCSPPASTAR